ncbi:MAG: PAS domain S-box protein [Euryarchaeota archaeon]|nr:PAS domain S-box protein [Euryarchaeota archaeon]
MTAIRREWSLTGSIHSIARWMTFGTYVAFGLVVIGLMSVVLSVILLQTHLGVTSIIVGLLVAASVLMVLGMAIGAALMRQQAAPGGLQEAQRLVDLAPEPLFLVNSDGSIRYANATASRVFGRSPSALRDQPIVDLLAPGSRDAFMALLREMGQGPSESREDFAGLRADGSTFPAAARVHREKVGDSEVFAIDLRDISERVALIEALATRGAELSRMNRELEQFAYAASHDLQEPLRMVGSFTELLKMRYGAKLDKDANEFLDFAQDGARRMRQLIDDLLTYSRLGRKGTPRGPVPMNEVHDEVLRDLRESIGPAHAEVSRGDLPTVMADRTQVRQLLQNLISNAIKFHGSGPPWVRTTAARVGPDWQFTVEDHGIGIAPEFQERVFVMFLRLHTRDAFPGSGIGLAIARKVADHHSGRIWIESTGEPGKGCRFHFTIPAEAPKPEVHGPALEAPARGPAVAAESLIEQRLKELA